MGVPGLKTKERFGYWIIKGRSAKSPGKYWNCLCDCGQERTVREDHLTSGRSKSCGCARVESLKRLATHKLSNSPAYVSWAKMMERCYDSRHKSFHNYGGRGISVCRSWHDVSSFVNDMGQPPARSTLDRIDSNGNYEPSNCRWATRKQQSRNRRDNKLLNYAGETRCISEWAERIGISHDALNYRLKKWSIEKAIETPRLLAYVRQH